MQSCRVLTLALTRLSCEVVTMLVLYDAAGAEAFLCVLIDDFTAGCRAQRISARGICTDLALAGPA